jgi:hypothetical protein
LKRKVPLEDLPYAISTINYEIKLGQFKKSDMEHVRALFKYWFDVELVFSVDGIEV